MAIKELKSVVLGSEDISKSPIIGTFEGECADGLVTNANNMDIPVEVWTKLFESDTYKQAIELGWYIGYLGHPEDPNCMDFKNACIVMTEGHIDDDGKVYGKFNLIDTPVGRIVKSFIDAGVTFGISVRGVGETTPNGMSEIVDADSFVFRGFDIVTFPAFENAIPEFQALAASSKTENQVKYKKICASLDTNLPDITSPVAIEAIQEQFSPNSAEYAKLEDRKSELGIFDADTGSADVETQLEVEQRKFDGIYTLYQEAQDEIAELEEQIAEDTVLIDDMGAESDYIDKKIQIFESTINNQNAKLRKITAQYETRNRALITANTKIKAENKRLVGSVDGLKSENAELKSKNKELRGIMASQKTTIDEMSKSNLKCNREIKSTTKKIESATQTISDQEQTIKELQSKLNETVKKQKIEASKSLNRDDENERLRTELVSIKKILAGYQSAYVDLYQSASGVDLSNIPITASTSIDDLHKVINQQNSVPIMASYSVDTDIIYDDTDNGGTSGIVSL